MLLTVESLLDIFVAHWIFSSLTHHRVITKANSVDLLPPN